MAKAKQNPNPAKKGGQLGTDLGSVIDDNKIDYAKLRSIGADAVQSTNANSSIVPPDTAPDTAPMDTLEYIKCVTAKRKSREAAEISAASSSVNGCSSIRASVTASSNSNNPATGNVTVNVSYGNVTVVTSQPSQPQPQQERGGSSIDPRYLKGDHPVSVYDSYTDADRKLFGDFKFSK